MTDTEELGPYEAWRAFEYAVAHIDERKAEREAKRKRDDEILFQFLHAQNNSPHAIYKQEDFRPMTDEEMTRYQEMKAANTSFTNMIASIFTSVGP